MIFGHEYSFSAIIPEVETKTYLPSTFDTEFLIRNIISVERFPYQEKRLQPRVTGSTPWWLSAWWQKFCHKTTQTHTERGSCVSRTVLQIAYATPRPSRISQNPLYLHSKCHRMAKCRLEFAGLVSFDSVEPAINLPALELPSKRSTFTAYSFLQKAVNELLHPTRTYEEISLICQNITTPVTKNGFHSEFLFSLWKKRSRLTIRELKVNSFQEQKSVTQNTQVHAAW